VRNFSRKRDKEVYPKKSTPEKEHPMKLKRIALIALALTMTLLFALPTAAILLPDGYEWDGHPGVRAFAADDEPIGFEPISGYIDIEPISADLDNDVEPVYVPGLEDAGIMAISEYLDIEPISADVDSGVPAAITYAALGIAVLALALAVVALVKKK